MADELIDIVDENNKPLGIAKMKSEAFKKGLWHHASHVWIYNSRGEILLQLRAKNKVIFPNRWHVAVGGHIGAGGNPLETALRESEEELGLKIDEKDLEFIEVIKMAAEDDKKEVMDNEFLYVYLLRFDGDIGKLKLQKEEVQEIRFFSPDEIEGTVISTQGKYGHDREYWIRIINEVGKRVALTNSS